MNKIAERKLIQINNEFVLINYENIPSILPNEISDILTKIVIDVPVKLINFLPFNLFVKQLGDHEEKVLF